MDADIGVQVCGFIYMKGHCAHSGFPEISYGLFADKLVRAGYKVARVEQTETPQQLHERKKLYKGKGAPKVVNREVCSILTMGTRTFCYLDQSEVKDKESIDVDRMSHPDDVGSLLAIKEIIFDVPTDVNKAECDEDEVQPVCEYGITVIDSVRGCITIGQFADDILRSRMLTLLTTFTPSEVSIPFELLTILIISLGLMHHFLCLDSHSRWCKRGFRNFTQFIALFTDNFTSQLSYRNNPGE